jgi:nitroimidazol reductase NimA-like FMN-containing flavoprotein (pyridoxamine 5'-phosphate oxidase superfamily)/ribosomal protein S18 acetylase RimI-like enzyme
MRKESFFRMSRADAVAFLERARVVHVATTNAFGDPIFRALDVAVMGDSLVFHGAPVGEKMEALGRPAIVSAEEVVASIPSYFVDPQRACPATTLYRSVQVHGTLDEITEPAEKARALEALLHKNQPEGGYTPIKHDDPLYAKAIAGLLVVSVSLERIDGKAKLAQNRTPDEQRRIASLLWKRGDADAAFAVVAANPHTPLPDFLRAPHGLGLDLGAGKRDAEACADLLEGEYWNDRFSRDEIIQSHVASNAWIVARQNDRVVASARAISDAAKYAWIYDVIVSPDWRGRAVGDAVMRLLLDHPAVRRARFVRLGTRDAMPFYANLGFIPRDSLPPRPYHSTEMVLVR